MFFQLFIDILHNTQSDNAQSLSAKQDFINHFKTIFRGNSDKECLIDEFEKDYHPQMAIKWYTRPTFLFRTLNKALRESDFEILFALRFFIVDLHQQLTIEHKKYLESYKSNDPILQVYRGQNIDVKELNYICQNIGQFLSMQSFISTSTSRQVGLLYVQGSAPLTTDRTRILFQFNIDTHLLNTKPYANIRHLSFFIDEEEVLIMLGSIFRIEQVEYDQSEQIWIATLSLCSEDDFELKDLMKQVKNEVGMQITSLGYLLVKQGKYPQARSYFQHLLLNKSLSEHDQLGCYYGLAAVAKRLKEYDKTLVQTQNMLRYYVKYNDQLSIARTFVLIGEILWRKQEFDLAQFYEEKSLEILLPNNDPNMSSAYLIMASIHGDRNEFDLSLKNLEKAFEIYRQNLPNNHVEFGVLYETIGVTYDRMKDYNSALENFVKANAIYQIALPPNHPRSLHLKKNIQMVKFKVKAAQYSCFL
ncbi:unnamed protein product [Rotaria sp. Silwood2]|nr:unnamed protein product [Rotaria sp. Silwood2]CAF4795010.1 unnamed protein product [Rotaria sp. Silwood2]